LKQLNAYVLNSCELITLIEGSTHSAVPKNEAIASGRALLEHRESRELLLISDDPMGRHLAH